MIKHRTPAPTHRRSTGGLTGYPTSTVGVHAFRIVGGPRKCLVNVGSLRLDHYPCMDSPAWRKGVGVVGMAWKKKDNLIVDWEAYVAANESIRMVSKNGT